MQTKIFQAQQCKRVKQVKHKVVNRIKSSKTLGNQYCSNIRIKYPGALSKRYCSSIEINSPKTHWVPKKKKKKKKKKEHKYV